MRRLIWPSAVFLFILLLPAGCGGNGLTSEVTGLLERRSGEIETISYACFTEDAGRLYREEFELRFPDDYRYRFFEYTGEQAQLLNYTVQSGMDIYRARLMQGGEGEEASLRIENISRVPPIRCSGVYLALYHLIGNADYFQSLLTLMESGELMAAGTEYLDGTDAFRLESAGGSSPRMRIWLDRETGLPLRKELTLSDDRAVAFRYENVVENPLYGEEAFPPDALPLFGEAAPQATVEEKDGGCRPVDIAHASAQAGFSPLLPQVQGFELAASYVRDPSTSDLTGSEGPTQFPDGYRELYLVLRSGARQVEIKESPYDPEFTYSPSGLAAFSGAYLIVQEVFGEEAGVASYTAAIDCQEMRLIAGDVELVVTGDLSREEFEALAVQLKELSDTSP